MVEHRLAKARVASSNLVSRSIPPSGARRIGYGGLERTRKNQAALPRRGTQVVRERSAKPLCVGSIPTRASNFSATNSGFLASHLRVRRSPVERGMVTVYLPSFKRTGFGDRVI